MTDTYKALEEVFSNIKPRSKREYRTMMEKQCRHSFRDHQAVLGKLTGGVPQRKGASIIECSWRAPEGPFYSARYLIDHNRVIGYGDLDFFAASFGQAISFAFFADADLMYLSGKTDTKSEGWCHHAAASVIKEYVTDWIGQGYGWVDKLVERMGSEDIAGALANQAELVGWLHRHGTDCVDDTMYLSDLATSGEVPEFGLVYHHTALKMINEQIMSFPEDSSQRHLLFESPGVR